MKDERDLRMQLTYSILDDAVDLGPVKLQKMITPQDSLEEAMKGAREFGKDDQLPKPLLSAADYGAAVAYVIRELYGEEVQDFYIPQAVYYNGFSKVDNLKKAFEKAKNAIKISKISKRDRYNEALSLIINIWINHTPGIKKSGTTMPKEGVYLRDDDNMLYPYNGVSK